jgi:hypothetical protein
MLYDTRTMSWKMLAVTSAANPIWSKDSKALYFHAYKADMAPILRVTVPDGHMEELTSLAEFRANSITRTDFPVSLPMMFR